MKSLKFDYKEEEINIKYEFYCFKGSAIPKDIKFKDISDHGVSLYWKIDNLHNINIDNNKIKYKIEMRKDNGQFIQIYEGNNLNYTVDNLETDTNYEFGICSFYNNINGYWTDIHKIKTMDIDSIILKDLAKRNEYRKKILEWCGYKRMELIYRGSKDGMLSKNFLINVIIKDQQLLYIKMKNVFSENIHLYVGLVMKVIINLLEIFYLL